MRRWESFTSSTNGKFKLLSLHENPFHIVDEDVIAAAPAFNVIKEDDVDDDLDI